MLIFYQCVDSTPQYTFLHTKYVCYLCFSDHCPEVIIKCACIVILNLLRKLGKCENFHIYTPKKDLNPHFESLKLNISLILHSACKSGTDCTTLYIQSLWNSNLQAYFHSLPKRTPLENLTYAYDSFSTDGFSFWCLLKSLNLNLAAILELRAPTSGRCTGTRVDLYP